MEIKVYANSDDAQIVWKIAAPIDDCRGFAIYRRRHGETDYETLKNRVGFKGEKGDENGEQPSTVWPFQRFMWTDYKASSGDVVSYRVVPMVGGKGKLEPKMEEASPWTDEITVSPSGAGGIAAYFNRGIVASQWLSRVLSRDGSVVPQKKLSTIIDDPADRTRKFLAGEIRIAILKLLDDVKKSQDRIYAALFELNDPELISALGDLGNRANVILANGAHKSGKDENESARKELGKAKVHVFERLAPSTHLAHNKFVVVSNSNDAPQYVLTGSTNWTKTGLCTQANNAIIVKNSELAGYYKAQWDALKDAGDAFTKQLKVDNAQRSASLQWAERSLKVWFTPLGQMQDLEEARQLIHQTRRGLLFLMFNPGPTSESLLSAITDLQQNSNVIVKGVVNQDPSTAKNPVQIFRTKDVLRGSFQVALPAAIEKHVSYWIPELKKLQGAWAMVHSKVIVIDPFGNESVVMTGSHNMGPAASKNNDDNLLIIKNDPELAAAYAVNIISIFSNYRWRYNRLYNKQARAFTDLKDNAKWQDGHLRGDDLKELNFWLGK